MERTSCSEEDRRIEPGNPTDKDNKIKERLSARLLAGQRRRRLFKTKQNEQEPSPGKNGKSVYPSAYTEGAQNIHP